MRRSVLCLLLVGFGIAGHARAEEKPAPTAPTLRLVWIKDGARSVAPERDLTRFRETSTYKEARRRGVDLEKPTHPLLAARFDGSRLYYVFYKTAERAFGTRPYLIQRIRKTERTWASASSKPVERVTYQVEVFKTFGGELKRADQHFGSFGLRENHRREVVKEYEIGIGEIPGRCEGEGWPYEPKYLSKIPHPYDEERGMYDDVKFLAKTDWSLTVSFGADGSWRVASPELGFDAPSKMPDPAAAVPPPDPKSKDIVLVPGKGLSKLAMGKAKLAALKRVLGAPLAWTTFPNGKSSHTFPGRLNANLDEKGRLYVLSTNPGFAGRTAEGLRHGDSRWKVMQTMGVPKDQNVYGWTWSYDGVRFWFDAFDRVHGIGIYGEK